MQLTRFFRQGIPLKLFFTVPVVLLFICTAVSISLISYVNGQQAAMQFGQQLTNQITMRTHEQLDALLSVPKIVIDNSLQAFESGMFDVGSEIELTRYLMMQINRSPFLTFVSVGFANGQYLSVNRDINTGQLTLFSSMQASDLVRQRFVLQANGLKGELLEQSGVFDARHRGWFMHAVKQGEASWYPIYHYASFTGLGVGISAPLYTASGQLQAVMAVDFSLSHLSLYLQSLQLTGNGFVFMTDPIGNLVAASVETAQGQTEHQEMLKPAIKSSQPLLKAAATMASQSPDTAQQSFEYAGERYLLHATDFIDEQGLKLKIFVVLPEQELMQVFNESLMKAMALMFVAVMFGIFLTLLLSRQLIRPVVALHQWADQLALRGGHLKQLYRSNVFELNGLIQSFELMASKMAMSFATLEDKVEQGTATLERLSLIVSRTRNGVVITDPQGRIEWVNPAFEYLLQRDASQLHQQRLTEILQQQKVSTAALQPIQAAFASGVGFSEEVYWWDAIGTAGWLSLECDAVFNEQGQLTGFILICLDITARKQLESEVKERQQRTELQRRVLAQLVLNEAVSLGDTQGFAKDLAKLTAEATACPRVSVWMMSPEGDELICLALHQTQTSTPVMQLKRQQYPDYFTAIENDGWVCAHDALSHPATQAFAESYLKPAGICSMLDAGILIAGQVVGIVCLEYQGGLRHWQSDEEAFVGAVAAIMAQSLAIAQRREAEQISKEYAEHTQTILNHVIDGIVTMDAQGEIISLNPAAQALFRCTESDMLGAHVTELFLQQVQLAIDVYRPFFPSIATTPQLGVLREIEAAFLDGRPFAIEFALSAISRQGRVVYICTLRDISERKRLERLKNEFVSTVSHELRTPLTSITGAIGLLQSGQLGEFPGHCNQLLQVAYSNCQRLTWLVNDLLDIEKIAAGKMQFHLQPEPVWNLLQQAIDANKMMAEQKQVKLCLESTETQDCIQVDAHRFLQILSNFLSNAIKFSPNEATVRISMQRVGEQIRIAVTDQGPGISAQFRPHIFQRFSQADSSDSRKIGGTGLGLCISKELVHGMGGEIGFESEEGSGATFYCCFPLCPASI